MVCYTLALLSVVACCFLFLEVTNICVSFLLNLQLLHTAIVFKPGNGWGTKLYLN
jgi:hypothetical protein